MSDFTRCARCVMDNGSDTTIRFDQNGVCNYCTTAVRQMPSVYFPNSEGESKLKSLIDKLKREGQGKAYDCLMGISGGLDSSYLAYLGAVKWKLRILAIHIDDGFDTDLAKENIENLCRKAGIELISYAPDAEQFNDLTKAFFLAEVANAAIPQDNVLFSCLYKLAAKHKVKYFLSGGNFALESILQKGDNSTFDKVFIKDIHRRFGSKPIDKILLMSHWQRLWIAKVKGIKTYRPLNYIDYNKNRAICELEDFCGFRYYEAKHLENTLTKMIQLHWFYRKFGVDKRKSHLSSLIVSGQLSREEALRELEKPISNPEDMNRDVDYVLNKIGLGRDVFDKLLSSPGKRSQDYRTDRLFRMFQSLIDSLGIDKKKLVQ